MQKPESGAEKSWFRVDLQVYDNSFEESRLALAGFIAFSKRPEGALKKSVQDLQRFGKGLIIDPQDPAHKVYPLCENDTREAEQTSVTWAHKNQDVALISFSND